MKKPSKENWDTMQAKVVGIGEPSFRRSCYPKLQEKLSELERFKTLIHLADDMIFLIHGQTGKLVDVSRSMCIQLGYSREELLTMRVEDVLLAKDASIPIDWRKKRPRGEKGLVSTRLSTRNGLELPVETTLSSITFNEVPYFVAVARDITEHKRVVEELRKSQNELELRVKERTAELELANENLRLVPSRLIGAQENERQRLAVELHDSIGQTLAALKFRIEHVIIVLEKQEYKQGLNLLHEFIPVLQRSIDETRTIYMGLKPTVLTEYGLLAALNWYRREILKIHPEHHIELETSIDEKDIPEGIKIAIFRITQEAVNNSFKHGAPEWVSVRLALNNDAIELEISDDGIGMNLDHIMGSHSANSLGLIGMRERAELTGGEFLIESCEHEGTSVRAIWRNQPGGQSV